MFLSFALVVAIFIFNFFLKRTIAIKSRYYTTDEYTHLCIIKYIKEKQKIPETFDYFLIDRYFKLPFSYPFLFHCILSLLPLEWLSKHVKDISAFIDSLNILLIGLFLITYTQNISILIVVLIIYLLIPFMLLESLRFTPRILSYMIINSIIISLILLRTSSSITYIFLLILTGVMVAAIFFMHKFSSQVLLIILFSIFLFLPDYRIDIFYSLLITSLILVIFRKFYKKILIEHIGCIRKSHWYCKTLDFKIKKIGVIFLGIPIFLIFIFYMKNPGFFVNNKTNFMLMTISLSLYISGILTVFIPILRCFGEGERYVEYTIFPSSFLIGYFLVKNFSLLNFLLVFFPIGLLFCGIFSALKGYIRKKKLSYTLLKICKKIKKLLKNNLWFMAENAEPPLVAFFGQKNVIYFLNISFYFKNLKFFEKLEEDIDNTIKKFKIDYILTDKKTFQKKKQWLNKYKIKFKEGRFILIETSP